MDDKKTPPADQGKQAQPEKQNKNSVWSRVVLALAFSTIGAKTVVFGIIADANKLLKGQGMSFMAKLRGAFNGTLKQRLMEDLRKNAANATTTGEMVKAAAKTFKYSTIALIGGNVVGGVLGWVRGGRIENPKDILTHPIKSLKLALGPAPKPKKVQVAEAAAAPQSPAATDSGDTATTRWREMASTQSPAQQAQANR